MASIILITILKVLKQKKINKRNTLINKFKTVKNDDVVPGLLNTSEYTPDEMKKD